MPPSSSPNMHQFTSLIPPSLLNLPSEIIDHIAYLSTLGDDNDDAVQADNDDSSQDSSELQRTTLPSTLPALLLTCRKLHSVLKASANPSLYARIFRSRFDTSAIHRRYGHQQLTSLALAAELQRRYTILKRIRLAATSGTLWDESEDEEQDDVPGPIADAIIEENLWLAYLMMTENDGKNLPQLKWARIDTYLALHHEQVMLASACRPAYPPESPGRSLALHLAYLLTDPEQLAHESKDDSDEKLFVLRPFVFGAHRFDAFLAPWTLRHLPLTPADETRAEQAPAGPSSSAAPTIQRPSLVNPPPSVGSADAPPGPAPQGGADEPAAPANVSTPHPPYRNPFLADLRPRSRICTIQHCGLTLRVAPPMLTHAAFMSFFLKVERDPAVLQLTAILDPDTNPPVPPSDAVDDDTAPAENQSTTATSTSIPADRRPSLQVAPFNRSPLSFTSRDHDADLSRLFACLDPYRSPGLHPLFYAGAFEGNWEGRFCFFDFDSYRDMLGGRMQSLYEGAFGEQPQVWKVTETVVRTLPRLDSDDANVLNADFLSHSDEQEEKRMARAQEYRDSVALRKAGKHREDEVAVENEEDTHGWSRSYRARWNNAYPSRRSEVSSEAGSKVSARRAVGSSSDPNTYARAATSGRIPPDWRLYPRFEPHEEPSAEWLEDHPEAHEILLSGTGHSAWGRFVLRGRVRSWDGLLTITKEYRPDGRGRWLYRGYCVAGGKLVGRWRDTFTPDNMCGYEGCFLLSRRESS